MIILNLTSEIQAPLQHVIELFQDRSKLPEWQHGFISDVKIKEGKDGIQYKLVYKAGKRNITLTETVVFSDLPARYDVIYRMKGMKNIVQHCFTATSASVTLWEAKHTFKFRWLMMLIGPRMKDGLEEQSKLLMRHFKLFVEREFAKGL